MKTPHLVFVSALLLIAAACSTPDSRVKKNETAFQSWPPAVQENVRAGRIDVGYNQQMVRVALGEPDRLASRTTAHGTADVWIYFDKGPKFSLGLGFGSMHGSTGVGGGLTVGDDWRDQEILRVIFEGGLVTAVERRK
jgi:outer membrane protein assembly factor BamE (lipoprotein component of BamABCDE complex)